MTRQDVLTPLGPIDGHRKPHSLHHDLAAVASGAAASAGAEGYGVVGAWEDLDTEDSLGRWVATAMNAALEAAGSDERVKLPK